MPIADKVVGYSVAVLHNNVLDESRNIHLSLESGGTADIVFVDSLPSEWLVFLGWKTDLYMRADLFADTYHLLQSEAQVYFTALNIDGIQVGSVHTKLDLIEGEPTRVYARDAQSLATLVRRARQLGTDQNGKGER